MSNAQIFDTPMELRLELVTIVGSDFAYTEGELFNDVVDEVDRVGLGMFFIDLERPNAGRVINGRILEATCLLALLSNKSQELDIHLDMVTRNLLVVAFGVNLTRVRSARQPPHAVALKYSIYGCIGQFDAVIARKVPHNPFGSEVVFAPEMKHLIHHFRQCLVMGI